MCALVTGVQTCALPISFESSLQSKLGFLMSRPALQMLRVHLDPNNHNGAAFLGLNGLEVKRHGGANSIGIANAIGVDAALVREEWKRVETGKSVAVRVDTGGRRTSKKKKK